MQISAKSAVKLNAAFTYVAIAILAAVAILGIVEHNWADAGFALAVGIHYVKELV